MKKFNLFGTFCFLGTNFSFSRRFDLSLFTTRNCEPKKLGFPSTQTLIKHLKQNQEEINSLTLYFLKKQQMLPPSLLLKVFN